jgi:hypothetical protein
VLRNLVTFVERMGWQVAFHHVNAYVRLRLRPDGGRGAEDGVPAGEINLLLTRSQARAVRDALTRFLEEVPVEVELLYGVPTDGPVN